LWVLFSLLFSSSGLCFLGSSHLGFFVTSLFLVFEGDIRVSKTCALELSFSFHFLGILGKARG